MWENLATSWQLCFEQAWIARCAGSLPIGAAVISSGGVAVARGHNSTRHSSEQKISGHRLAHAEINALLAADFSTHSPKECVLYCSTEPCPLCVGAAVMANVGEIRFASRDPWSGSTDLLDANSYLKNQKVVIKGPEDADFERLLIALQIEYHLGQNEVRAQPLLEAWRAIVPAGVDLGQRLYRDGTIEELVVKAAPLIEFYNNLESRAA